MYASRYYEGMGKTPADRINNHAAALGGSVTRAARELGETPGLATMAPLPADRVVEVRLPPELPGPAPVVPMTPELVAALAADAVMGGLRP